MNRILRSCCLLLLTCFYGCFEITEEITINRNGSGTASYAISAEWLSSLIGEMDKKTDSTNTSTSAHKLLDKSSSMELKLKGIDGVENSFARVDKETSSIVLGFDFKSIDALNKALSSINADSTQPFEEKKYYASSKRKFSRTNEYYKKEENKKEVNNEEHFNKLVNSMMESATYKVIINLPSNARKVKVDNPKALIGNNGKKVILEHKLLDLAKNKESLAFNIKYR